MVSLFACICRAKECERSFATGWILDRRKIKNHRKSLITQGFAGFFLKRKEERADRQTGRKEQLCCFSSRPHSLFPFTQLIYPHKRAVDRLLVPAQYCPRRCLPKGQQAEVFDCAAYLISRKYLCTVGLLRSHTLASSLTFILPAMNVG